MSGLPTYTRSDSANIGSGSPADTILTGLVGIRIFKGNPYRAGNGCPSKPSVSWVCGRSAVYSLHCPEMGAPFIDTCYLLGILIPTVLGALLGKTLLRW